eukprot:jgi/Mesvir1/15525/Mv03177-RA.1
MHTSIRTASHNDQWPEMPAPSLLDVSKSRKLGAHIRVVNADHGPDAKELGDASAGAAVIVIADERKELLAEDFEHGSHHGGKARHGEKPLRVLMACAMYCGCSSGMILVNKHVLSSFEFEAPVSLLFLQSAAAASSIGLLALVRIIDVERLSWRIFRLWMPVNVLFVLMVWTGICSLRHLSVPMVTILKNLTNILVAVGDIIVFKKRQSRSVWWTLALLVVSAIAGGATDLAFSSVGYAWQLGNCAITAMYLLYLRLVMNQVKLLTRRGTMDEFSMVLLNNVLSLPLVLVLAYVRGELPGVFAMSQWHDRSFLLATALSCVVGTLISFSSLWLLHVTSPTTHSLIGSINKIPTALLGIVVFNAPTSVSSLLSLFLGLAADIFFSRALMTCANVARKWYHFFFGRHHAGLAAGICFTVAKASPSLRR